MVTQNIAMDHWVSTDYRFEDSMAYQLMTLTEDAMTSALKDAKLKARIYVNPEILDQFLALLAKSYHEEFEEAYTVTERIGLTKRHMDAIRDDYEAIQKEIEDDFYGRAMDIRYINKGLL